MNVMANLGVGISVHSDDEYADLCDDIQEIIDLPLTTSAKACTQENQVNTNIATYNYGKKIG